MRWLLLLFCLGWLIPAHAVKPRVPLALSWEVLQRDGEVVRLGLDAISALDSVRARVVMQLPAGARLLRGETRWEGMVPRGRQRLLEVVVSGGDGPLRATAELVGAVSQRAEAIHLLGGVVPSGVVGRRDKSRSRWSLHGGRGVWEYRVDGP